MSSKFSSITAAVGATLALASAGTAHALAPNQPIAASVLVGGATAQDPGFLVIARTICQNNPIDLGNLAASDATRMDAYVGTDNAVYTCKSNGAVVANNTNIAIYKTAVGGSGTGTIAISRQVTSYGSPTVNVVFLPTNLTTLPNSGNCTTATSVVGAITVGAKTAAQYLNHTACGAGNRAVVPQIGLADVEPALVDGSLPSDTARLSTTAVNHGIFGFAVSEPLRNALQAAQGLVACTVARGDASRELLANQPSLTRGQIAAIISGNITNWNQITARGSNLGVYSYVAANPGAGCPLPTALAGEGGARTFVARRVPSSGTQAIAEIWALKQRCAASVAPFLDDSDSAGDGSTTDPTWNPDNYVQAYSSSSGVRHALDRASGPWSAQTSPAPLSATRWQIGLLSCENTPAGTAPRAYRFLKVHGATPGLRDTANSAYDFYAEQVVNTSNAVPPPAGLPAAFADYLKLNLADPDVLRTVNAGIPQPGTNLAGIGAVAGDWVADQGQGCLLAVPDGDQVAPPAQPLTASSIQTTPVNTSWKRPLGETNNCQDPVTLGVLEGRTPVGGFNQTNPQ